MIVTLTESDKKIVDNYIGFLEKILAEREASCNALRESIETVKSKVYPVETPPIESKDPITPPSEGPETPVEGSQSGETVSDGSEEGGDNTGFTTPSEPSEGHPEASYSFDELAQDVKNFTDSLCTACAETMAAMKNNMEPVEPSEPEYDITELVKDLTIIARTRDLDPYSLVRYKKTQCNESLLWNVFRSIAINSTSDVEDPLMTSIINGFMSTWCGNGNTARWSAW